MKTLIIVLAMGLILGCAARVAIPPEPRFKQIVIYNLEGGAICIDGENANNLRENVKAMRDYQAELLRLLKEVNK